MGFKPNIIKTVWILYNNLNTGDAMARKNPLWKRVWVGKANLVTLDDELSNRLMEFFRRVYPVKVLLARWLEGLGRLRR